MSVCEKCWKTAQRRARNDHSKTTSEHYMDILREREDNPCTEAEQKGISDD